MSLQVWLPLNGDLHNQGLDSAILSGSNLSWKVGKIGEKSLYTATGSQEIIIPNLVNKQQFSICYWIKTDTSLTSSSYQPAWRLWYTNNVGTGYIRHETTSTNGSQQLVLYKENNTGGNTNIYYSIVNSNSFTGFGGAADTWIHCALIKDLTQTKVYINGSLKITTNNTNYEVSTGKLTGKIRIGGISSGANFCLNDFRIYDHCLSSKEVEEISKGLILHYPLNNYYLSENFLTNSTGYQGLTDWNSDISIGDENGQKYIITSVVEPKPDSRTFLNHSKLTSKVSSWLPGEKFTLSGWYKIPSSMIQEAGGNLFLRWAEADSNNNNIDTGFTASINILDKWIYFENTYEVPVNFSSGKTVSFYVAFAAAKKGTVYWKNIKLEKGEKATQWCPAITDSLYTALGYNNNVIYDTSGYCNNGTIIGNLNTTTPSPRYNCCIEHLDSCIDYIYRPYLSFLDNSGFTFSCWINPTSYSRTNGGTYEVGSQFILSQGRDYIIPGTDHTYGASLAIYRGQPRFFCGNGILYSQTTIPIGEWAHIVGVWTGTQKKIYINGVLENSANDNKIDWSEAQNSLVIGKMAYGKSSSTAFFPFVGKISDVRIYATALTDSQIKELYNTSMQIDSSGNVFARELVE